jgi:hypothetical protein
MCAGKRPVEWGDASPAWEDGNLNQVCAVGELMEGNPESSREVCDSKRKYGLTLTVDNGREGPSLHSAAGISADVC